MCNLSLMFKEACFECFEYLGEEGVLQEMLDWNVCPVVGCFWSNAVLIELYSEVLGIWMHNPPHLCVSSPTCFKC